ncbi:hypothetical protein IC762_28950 [Bradyrhizobium genosp. L]|uniref:hypothetical protein n=1 Tax=Bradyrhizobium genosp. L TaxID=83637 RepID=UPI0018A32FC6|nr:hypothetical protein [Bradyrhizobium genosp. L]QPF83691.1 hypothetical protein IC762_28950 [Bradyrhizobium genosp. L]
MRRVQPGYVTSTCIEAFPLVADLAKSDMLMDVLKRPAPDDDERRDRFAARANAIMALIECSDEVRPKLREAIVEAMLWAREQP